jgi:hypothetical protein
MSQANVPRYSRIPSHLWTDEEFSRLSDRAKLGTMYVLSCPHRCLEGIFKLPPHYAIADLGWTMKTWNSVLTILQESGFLKWDSRTNVMLIVNALRYQSPENPNQIASTLQRISNLPDTPLLHDFYELALEHCSRNGAGQAAQDFAKGLHQQLVEQLGKPLAPLNLVSKAISISKSKSKLKPAGRNDEGTVRSVGSGSQGSDPDSSRMEEISGILQRFPQFQDHLQETSERAL